MKKHFAKIHAAVLHRFHGLGGHAASHSHVSKKSLAGGVVTALLFAAFFGMVGTYILDHDAKRTPHNAELAFADLSPSGEMGGRILPASCESGYDHTAGRATILLNVDRTPAEIGASYQVNKFGNGNFCFGNFGGGVQTFTAAQAGNPYNQAYGWYTRSGGPESTPYSGVRQTVIRWNTATVYDGVATGQVTVGGVTYIPGTYRGSVYGWSSDYSNAFDVTGAQPGGGSGGGGRYLVPLNSWGEFSSFYNAIPRLQGLYVIP